jgi:hypothetical protein
LGNRFACDRRPHRQRATFIQLWVYPQFGQDLRNHVSNATMATERQ